MVAASQAPNRYGAALATYLTQSVDPENAAHVMQHAVDVVCDIFEGKEPAEVPADVRAALCSIWDIDKAFITAGFSLDWIAQLTTFGIDFGQEWYMLAVLAVPNLSREDIRALSPFRNGQTVGIAQALRNHPSVDADLIVDLIYRTWNEGESVPSLYLGPLAELARHSLEAKAAAVIISYGVNGPDGIPVEAYREAVDVLSRAGHTALKHFTVLIDDQLATPGTIISGERLVEYAAGAALL